MSQTLTQSRNGPQLWGHPREVPIGIIQRRRTPSRMSWGGLCHDVLLRLEKTPASRAIEYPFPDAADCHRAAIALRKHFDKYAVLISTIQDGNGGRLLYARRGPKWGK